MIIAGLLLFIPISLMLAYGLHAAPLWVFAAAGLAIIPVADWIRRATGSISWPDRASDRRVGERYIRKRCGIDLGFVCAEPGHTAGVKAQITDSLTGTSLQGRHRRGGITRPKLTSQREGAGSLGIRLILGVIALLLPAIFDYNERRLSPARNTGSLDENLSISLVCRLASGVCRKCGSQFDFGQLADNSRPLGLKPAVPGRGRPRHHFGNAAEMMAATYFARQNRMDLTMGLCLGSSVQVALLLAPALVLISHSWASDEFTIFQSSGVNRDCWNTSRRKLHRRRRRN